MTTYPNNYDVAGTSVTAQRLFSRKYIAGGLLAFVVLVVGIAILLKADVATLNISSDEGSLIYVASQPSGEFTEVGTTSATYSTEDSGNYYIKVVNGPKITHTAVNLKTGETVDVAVGLEDLKAPSSISNQALSHPLITKDFAYGINPGSKSLSYAPLGDKNFTRFFFFGMPFTTKVDWVNKNNFVFVSSSGTGAVIDGSISSLGNPGTRGAAAINYDYLDATVLNDNSIALVSIDGLYIKDSLKDKSATKIDSLAIDNSPGLFSDNNYIYLVVPAVEFPGGDEGLVPEITGVEFKAYSYSGDKQFEYSLAINNMPTKIVDSGDNHFILSAGASTLLLNKSSGQISTLPVYFPSSNDFLIANNKIIVLNEDGLWEYNINDNSYYLISPLPVGGEYVAGSLTNSRGAIYFSTAASRANLQRPSGSLVSDAIYRLEL